MNGMISEQQAQGQPQQQAQGQPQQQGKGAYPQNKEEVQAFITDIMNALYSEETQQQLMQVLSSIKNDEQLPQILGQLSSSVVMSVVQRRHQENGKKPHIRLVINGLQMVLKNLAEMMKVAGIKEVSDKVLQEAAMVAGNAVEKLVGGQPQQQAQGQPQQQAQGQPQQRMV